MTKVLVTGATGFLGRATVEALARDGSEVHLLLRPSSDSAALRGLTGPCRIHRSDGSPSSLRRILALLRPRTVLHLAGRPGHPGDRDFEDLAEANFLLGARLADASLRAGVNSFVATGTYWQRREHSTPDPRDLYAAFKQCQEELLRWYGCATALRTATVVLYDVYGPGDTRGKVLSSLANAARSGKPLDLSPGRQRLELVFVEDAVAAMLRAAALVERRPSLSGSTWHAPSIRPVTLRAAAAAVGRLLGPVPARWGAKPYRPRETMRPWRGPAVPGWKPRVDLAEGLRRTFAAVA